MRTRHFMLVLFGAASLSVAGFGLYRVGVDRGMQASQLTPRTSVAVSQSTRAQKIGDVDPSTGKKILYWHDPMVPGQKFDKPGKSPFMDMQLVPVYAESGSSEGSVAIDPRVRQNLGIRTAPVKQGVLAVAVEAVGSIAYNERDVVLVQARSNGFVERLYVRAPLDPVRQGQPLADLYIPDWVAAQEEYLSVKRINSQSGARSLDGLV